MKIVLIVEDLPEEQARAKEAAMAAGFRPAITATLNDAFRIWKSLEGKLAGVITDLHFPEMTSENSEYSDASKPCGLAIVAEATAKGIPVVVCSNINHHFVDYPKKVIDVLATFHPVGSIPFVMDAKDWARAVVELNNVIEKEERRKNEESSVVL